MKRKEMVGDTTVKREKRMKKRKKDKKYMKRDEI